MTRTHAADQPLIRARAREFQRAHRRRLARGAQAELVRLGRPPGSMVGAVERLGRAQEQDAAALARVIVETLLVDGIPGHCALAQLRRLGRDPGPLVTAVERLRSIKAAARRAPRWCG
jgi:hypothetical protein